MSSKKDIYKISVLLSPGNHGAIKNELRIHMMHDNVPMREYIDAFVDVEEGLYVPLNYAHTRLNKNGAIAEDGEPLGNYTKKTSKMCIVEPRNAEEGIPQSILEFSEETYKAKHYNIDRGFMPRNRQWNMIREMGQKLEEHKACTIVAPPGEGKTKMILFLIAAINKVALVVVPGKPLVDQWYKAATELMPKADVQQISSATGAQLDTSCRIFIVFRRALPKIQCLWLNKHLEVLVLDETQQMATADIVPQVLPLIPRYVIGASATPTRTDGFYGIINAILGNEIVSIKAIVPFMFYRVRIDERGEEIQRMGMVGNAPLMVTDYGHMKRTFEEKPAVIEIITNILTKLIVMGRKVLAITDSVPQAEILAANVNQFADLNGYEDFAATYLGNSRTFDGEALLLIGTSQKVGTGFDLAQSGVSYGGRVYDTVVFLRTNKSTTTLYQKIGRALRTKEVPMVVWLESADEITSNHFEENRAEIIEKCGYIVDMSSSTFLDADILTPAGIVPEMTKRLERSRKREPLECPHKLGDKLFIAYDETNGKFVTKTRLAKFLEQQERLSREREEDETFRRATVITQFPMPPIIGFAAMMLFPLELGNDFLSDFYRLQQNRIEAKSTELKQIKFFLGGHKYTILDMSGLNTIKIKSALAEEDKCSKILILTFNEGCLANLSQRYTCGGRTLQLVSLRTDTACYYIWEPNIVARYTKAHELSKFPSDLKSYKKAKYAIYVSVTIDLHYSTRRCPPKLQFALTADMASLEFVFGEPTMRDLIDSEDRLDYILNNMDALMEAVSRQHFVSDEDEEYALKSRIKINDRKCDNLTYILMRKYREKNVTNFPETLEMVGSHSSITKLTDFVTESFAEQNAIYVLQKQTDENLVYKLDGFLRRSYPWFVKLE